MLKSNSCALLLFLDFSSAFDTIDHKLLLYKLERFFNIKGTALKWIASFLEDRHFKVKIDNELLSTTVNHGVPQGSVLGPPLFSLYTQEIHEITDSYNFHMLMTF